MMIKNILKKEKRFVNSAYKGFTLIETLVSIMILSLVITSVVSLMSSNIFSARYAKNEIKATYVAQEGLDYIRNLRDSIAFNQTTGWTSFSTNLNNSECSSTNGCTIVKPFTGASFASLIVSSAPVTPLITGEFRNIINIECKTTYSTCDEIEVVSRVEWLNGSVAKSRQLKTTLTKWN